MPRTAKDPQVALGRAIRLRREELGISQQDLGLEVGYDQGWISHIENGRTNPAYGTVDGIIPCSSVAPIAPRRTCRVHRDRGSQAARSAPTPRASLPHIATIRSSVGSTRPLQPRASCK